MSKDEYDKMAAAWDDMEKACEYLELAAWQARANANAIMDRCEATAATKAAVNADLTAVLNVSRAAFGTLGRVREAIQTMTEKLKTKT